MSRRLLAPLLLAATAVHGQWQWEQLPDFPGTPRDDAAAFSIECHTYVGTGMQVGWSLTNDWWRWDPFAQEWSQAPTLPASPRQYCTAQGFASIGLLFGGLDASGPLAELWSFDAATQSWSQRSPLPGPGRYACSSFVLNGKLYIAGGIVAGGSALNELWEYDVAADAWSQRAALPGVGRHRMASAEGGIVMGGADALYEPLDEVWQYDPVTDEWAQLPPLPEGRFGGAGAVWQGDLCFIAGAVNNVTFRADALRYSASGGWQSGEAPLPSERRGGASATVGCAGGWYFLSYGLGLDGAMARRNDWYGMTFAFLVDERAPDGFSVHPNPASGTVRLPDGTTFEEAMMLDAYGRVVARYKEQAGSVLPIGQLPAGSYSLCLREPSRTRIARFIKLP